MTGWLRRLVGRRRAHVQGEGGVTDSGQRAESDVPPDRGVARTRATGGVPDPAAPDQHSTTGTTPTRTFVGRVAGNDAWSGETGAEIRAAAHRGCGAGGSTPARGVPKHRRSNPSGDPGGPAGRGWTVTGRRGRIGPVLGEMFAARSDPDAVGHLDSGPFVGGVTDAVAVGELTSLEFDALQSVLTGASFRDVLDSGEGGLVEAASDTGPWLSRVRPQLVTALAGVDAATVPATAGRWALRDEVEDVPAATLAAILDPLSELARDAGGRGLHLYLWNSLSDVPGDS